MMEARMLRTHNVYNTQRCIFKWKTHETWCRGSRCSQDWLEDWASHEDVDPDKWDLNIQIKLIHRIFNLNNILNLWLLILVYFLIKLKDFILTFKLILIISILY